MAAMDSSPPEDDPIGKAPAHRHEFARMFAAVPAFQLGAVAVLLVLAALTEGIGIALLVPLLELAGGAGAQSRPAQLLESSGISLSLGIVLLAFLGLVLLRSLLVYWLGKLRLRLQLDFADRLRRRCYAGLLHADWRWLASQRSADHNAALVTNSVLAGLALDQALSLMVTFTTALVLIAVSLALSWQVTLVALGLGALTLGAVLPILSRSTRTGQEINRANRDLHRQIEQGIARFREVKIHGAEASEIAGFEHIARAIRDRRQEYRDDLALGAALVQLGGASLLALLAYSGRQWAGLSLAELLPLLLIFLRLVPLLQAAQQSWSQWLHSLPALHELERITAAAEARAEPQLPAGESISLKRAIVLTQATVHHPGREKPALESADLSFDAGSTTAIIGPSGAGKSTLADLIGGLIAPDRGSIRIDDVEMNPSRQRRWRESVAYVQQSPLLHHGTVRDNLVWSQPAASESQLVQALTQASADFVLRLPQGLDTPIGDSGVRMSGGERQRIALARALLRQPQLLILDEITSALDAENETAVLEAVTAMRGNLTIVMIGHRPAMLALADQVIELRDGRVISPISGPSG